MMKEMTLGRYFPGSSLLHRSDPRTKISLTLVFMIVVFRLESYPALLLLLLFTFGLAYMAGKPLQHSVRSLKLILYLAVVAVVANLLIVKGSPLVDHGLLRHISREAISVSISLVLRLVLLASAASLLTFTTTPFALTEGLEKLLKPLNRIGVPVTDLAIILSIAMRFMPVIVEEARKLILAQSARSGDFNRGSLLQRTRSYLPLFIPLFAGVARRADAMVTAMEARCYRGSTGRTRLSPLQFSGADLACVGWMLVIMPVLMGIEYLRTGQF